MIGPEVRTLVVGHQVVEIELETDDRPRSTGLLIRVDGTRGGRLQSRAGVTLGVALMATFSFGQHVGFWLFRCSLG